VKPGTRILGVDPGATIGLALLEVEPRGRFRWVDHDAVRSENILAIWPDLLRGFGAAAIAVETPEGYVHEHQRGKHLIATAVLAGELGGRAHGYGYNVLRASPQECREALCGDRSANDASVKAVVLLRARAVPARTSEHVRDAALTAMCCSLRPGR
jgi:Holliday junction resolvasome RuvABC endonuclease subunit